jgi:hypothetical protein
MILMLAEVGKPKSNPEIQGILALDFLIEGSTLLVFS